ncbi:ResB-like family protein [Rubritalea squalenifaciens DSM 18772]|uniref:ResB-like family protein n=1 Tax=Rubritalea squalenifaciens DSM 18772 TaxID=1123071 RepID=A0A1M6I0B4_9BACT|nr:cytochrome c biogenesis protein ResB [Rubritalea squalenifaciens]SHJ27820.1 ResB-like family protein [Rubritalea squalenifaciens DSM 18772]
MSETSKNNGKQPTSLGGQIMRVLSGYEIAIISMLLLLLLTLFCTLEQVESGLYWTLKKYFSPEAVVVQPFFGGKDFPLFLPGGYWVCVVFTINLVLGGLIRARKGLKHIPVFVSHMCMVFIMVAGAVGYHQSKEAVIQVEVGKEGDFAQNLYVESIEVFEVVEGSKTKPTVINSDLLSALREDPEASRKFLLPDEFPFDLEVSGYYTSAQLSNDLSKAGMMPVVDGVFLQQTKSNPLEELNIGGCYLKVTDKSSGESRLLILNEMAKSYVTLTFGEKIYGFQMVREIWDLPFTLHLNDSIGEFFPNTTRPKRYESDIKIIDEEGNGQDFHIEMNEPLRHKDLTIYQTNWDDSTGTVVSGFTVKKNPSDQWPKIAIYISAVALAVHFLVKLTAFITNSLGGKRREH